MKFPNLRILAVGVVVSLLLICIYVQYKKNGQLVREREELSLALSQAEETIEVKQGIFQKKVVEVNNLKALLKGREDELRDSLELIELQNRQVVAYSELSIVWKEMYEGIAKANQTPEPPLEPGGPPRFRVDFSKEMGPFDVKGHTLTSPPEAFLSLEQKRPIKLGLALTQAADGTWTTVVSTSDGGEYDVDVALSAVDKKFELQNWRDKLSVDLDVGVYDSPSLGVGVKYGGKVAVGPKCSVTFVDRLGWSCGVGVSWRPFDR